MLLHDFLAKVAASYDRQAGLNTPTQSLLKRADEELASYAPGGFRIIGSGGKGLATYTPWVGFFDPDETTDPQEGVYVVFIFAEDLQSVTLTLNQGMEHLRHELGDSGARQRLAADAATLRVELPQHEIADLETSLSLASKGARQAAYVAGNIVARRYETATLPDDTTLRTDLDRVLRLYAEAVAAKRRLLLSNPGQIGSPSGTGTSPAVDPLADFKPKSDADYVASLKGKVLVKSRRHERVVRDYGEWSVTMGYAPATEHPVDLVLRRGAEEWLVEAKIVRLGNATEACRAALGQLFAYRHFLYSPQLRLLGLFSEDLGDAYTSFLSDCGIESVWRSDGRWLGTPTAVAAQLAEAVR
jgi:hypothetical protein